MKASQVLALLRDLDEAVPYMEAVKGAILLKTFTRVPFVECCGGCNQKMIGTAWFRKVLSKYQIPHDKVAAIVNAIYLAADERGCAIVGDVVLIAIMAVIDETGV